MRATRRLCWSRGLIGSCKLCRLGEVGVISPIPWDIVDIVVSGCCL